jgi:hypothetical protein
MEKFNMNLGEPNNNDQSKELDIIISSIQQICTYKSPLTNLKRKIKQLIRLLDNNKHIGNIELKTKSITDVLLSLIPTFSDLLQIDMDSSINTQS